MLLEVKKVFLFFTVCLMFLSASGYEVSNEALTSFESQKLDNVEMTLNKPGSNDTVLVWLDVYIPRTLGGEIY